MDFSSRAQSGSEKEQRCGRKIELAVHFSGRFSLISTAEDKSAGYNPNSLTNFRSIEQDEIALICARLGKTAEPGRDRFLPSAGFSRRFPNADRSWQALSPATSALAIEFSAIR